MDRAEAYNALIHDSGIVGISLLSLESSRDNGDRNMAQVVLGSTMPSVLLTVAAGHHRRLRAQLPTASTSTSPSATSC
jgi:hypothetical protein